MDNSLRPVEALVDEIKGTSNFIGKIFATRSFFVFALIVSSAVIAISVLAN